MGVAQQLAGTYKKAFGRCGRCFQEKEVVQFFFHWMFASGKYSLCEECLNIIGSVFEQKPDPDLKAPEYRVIHPDRGINRSFFTNLLAAVETFKQFLKRK